MTERAEQMFKPENLPYVSRIKLSFFRHAEKVGADSVDPVDKRMSLTPHGRKQAKTKGESVSENLWQKTLAVSSDRNRSQETALLAIAFYDEAITGEETLEELKIKVDRELKVGSRLLIDKRLDFGFVKGTPEFHDLQNAADNGSYLKRIVEKHDEAIKKKSGQTKTTYAIQAKNIAEIVDKYIRISPRWAKLVKDDEKDYPDTLERILVTHGGIGESFLVELIEHLKGRHARNEFLEMFPNGFDFVEGFQLEILTLADQSIKLRIKFCPQSQTKPYTFEEQVPLELIGQIIKDFSNVNES